MHDEKFDPNLNEDFAPKLHTFPFTILYLAVSIYTALISLMKLATISTPTNQLSLQVQCN